MQNEAWEKLVQTFNQPSPLPPEEATNALQEYHKQTGHMLSVGQLFPKFIRASGMRGKFEEFMPEFVNQENGWRYNGVFFNERTLEWIKVFNGNAHRGYKNTEPKVVYSDDVWRRA